MHADQDGQQILIVKGGLENRKTITENGYAVKNCISNMQRI